MSFDGLKPITRMEAEISSAIKDTNLALDAADSPKQAKALRKDLFDLVRIENQMEWTENQ